MRRLLSYANVMATLAFFFALTGGATAVNKYLMASDPITTGDLVGSTYGNPIIAAGAVTAAKIRDGAITSSKFDTSATAPNASKLAGLDVVAGGSATIRDVQPGEQTESGLLCPANRVPVTLNVSSPQVVVLATSIFTQDNQSGLRWITRNDGPELSVTWTVLCLGSG